MLARPATFIGGFMNGNPGPLPYLDQKGIASNVTVGNATLAVADICQGILNRTGPVGGFTDTFPNADDIIAAMQNPQKGDAFYFTYRNGVAQAMTFAAGTGIVSGIGTLSCAASSTKLYLFTVLATKRSTILVGNQINATAIISGLTNAQIATIEPGMGVTGTNVQANTTVLGVTPSDSATGATVTLSLPVTATLNNNPLSFFPRIQLDALGVMTN